MFVFSTNPLFNILNKENIQEAFAKSEVLNPWAADQYQFIAC